MMMVEESNFVGSHWIVDCMCLDLALDHGCFVTNEARVCLGHDCFVTNEVHVGLDHDLMTTRMVYPSAY